LAINFILYLVKPLKIWIEGELWLESFSNLIILISGNSQVMNLLQQKIIRKPMNKS